jgi:hypothetical protein
MIQMHTFIILSTLLTFSSVAVSTVLQEVLIVAKCIAGVHQELPNSCVYIMNSEGEEQGENNLFFFPPHECCVLEKCAQILRHQTLKVYLEIHFWK